jgi:hypothetical protein
VNRSTESLIAGLAQQLPRVRRLPPPTVRAVAWLAAVAAVSAVAIAALANLTVFLARAEQPRMAVELAATLLTGVAAVVAAFHLALPDRSRRWALAPLPPLAVWLATSGFGCYRDWVVNGPDGRTPGDSAQCFIVLIGVSVPLSALLFWRLAKARPLDPARTTAVGGLGVAALAAVVLQFFHPFEVTLMDLIVHLVAIALVIGLCSLIGPRAMGRAGGAGGPS